MNDDDIRAELANVRRQRAGASVVGTRSENSDLAARANNLSRRLGIAPDVIERNLREVEERDRADKNVRLLQGASPSVQQWFGNPRNAASASQDVEPMTNFASRYPAMGKFGPSVPAVSRPELLAGASRASQMAFQNPPYATTGNARDLYREPDPREQYRIRFREPDPRIMQGQMDRFEKDQAQQDYNRMSLPMKSAVTLYDFITGVPSSLEAGYNVTESGFGGAVDAVLDVAGQVVSYPLSGIDRVLGTDTVGTYDRAMRPTDEFIGRRISEFDQAAAEARPQSRSYVAQSLLSGTESIPTTVAGLFTGRVKTAMAIMGAVVGGQEYTKAREAGLDPLSAATYGAKQGGIEAATELIPGSKLLGDVAARSPFGKILFGQLVSEIPGEQVATVLQDYNEWATLNPEKPFEQFVRERPSAALDTLLATIGGVAGTSVGATVVNRTVDTLDKGRQSREKSRARAVVEGANAKLGAELLDGLMTDAENTKLRQTDPEAFRQFVEGLTEGTPLENVYLPAEAIRELMQDGYRDAPFWRDHADQIDEAIALEGDVVLPFDQVATYLAGTPEWQTLREDARFSPGGMSVAELASLEETDNQDREIAASRMEEQMNAAAAAAEPAARVYAEMRDQFQNAGFRPDAADRYASIWAANREAWAERLGMSAYDYHVANPVQVRRVLPEGLARSLPVDGLDIVINAMRAPEAAERRGKSLVEWIAERGGIEDRTGDVAAMGGGDWHKAKAFRRKLLRDFDTRQADMIGGVGSDNSADRLFESAISEGYFPAIAARLNSEDATSADAPDLNEFLNAIGNELRGTPTYANEEQVSDQTKRIREAAEELRQLLFDRNIDPNSATKAQIEAAIDERRDDGTDGRSLEQAATESEAFKKWFGDSKVVDANGKPLVVYHGTARDVEQFDAARRGENTGAESAGMGFFFSDSPRTAESYANFAATDAKIAALLEEANKAEEAGDWDAYDAKVVEYEALDASFADPQARLDGQNVVPVYLSIQNPLVVDAAGENAVGFDIPAALRAAVHGGHDGLIIRNLDDAAGLTNEEAGHYVVFEPTQIKSVNNVGTFDPSDPRILNQSGEQPRGRVSGGIISGIDGPSIIEVFEASDMSTVLHETSHVWLEELKRNATLPDAPADVVEDWQAVQDWFAENGHPVEGDFIPTEAHELFARGGERYFMEGKAPSSLLKRAFDAFRGWLLNIYEVVQNLRSPITPEIRRVFDRMLATREALDEASDAQHIHARFANAAQAGMTEEAFQAYRQLADDARTEAYDALLFRTMKAIERERTKEYQAQAATVRDEVTASINRRPEFRALHLLRTGRFLDDPERSPVKVKLDRDWIVSEFGEDALGLMPKGVPPLYGEKGTHPDAVANMVGYRSGEEMVRALMGLEVAKRALAESGDKRSVREATIANEVNRIMEERYGNPLDDGSIEEEALAAIANDRQAELIAAENRQLARQSNNRPTAYRVAREWAARKVAEGRVVDVASKAAIQRYARAMAKATKGFETALLEGNVDEAFRQSELRLLNHALIAEAKKAADKVEAAVGRLSRLAKQKVRKSTDQEYMDRAHALLSKFEFMPRSQKLLDEMEAFASWAEKKAAEGIDVVVPPRLESDGTHYTRMSVEELVGLDESVSQLLHLGRMKKTLLDDQERREFDEVVDEAVAVVEELPQRKKNNRMRPSWIDEKAAAVASADAALLKMEQIFDWLDNGNPNGVFNRLVFQPIAEAQAREREMTTEYLGQVREALRAMPKETVRRWEDQIDAPELLNRETGEPFELNRQALVSMALNVGNEGNFDKLARGYGWNADAIMRVLQRELTADDWRFVQTMWDLIDTLWPQIEAMEKRLNGVAPEKIEARSFSVTVGDEVIDMRGGYYPVVYDPLKSIDAEAQAARNSDALFENIYTRATTPKGFTKERTSVARPIMLSLSVLNRHLNEVIHDVTHREAIIAADKLLSSRRIMKAVDDSLGREIRKQFRPWLQHIANEWAIDRKGLEGWDALARRLRTHSTIIGMGYRLTTILAQTAGYAGVAERVGTRWIASGMKAFAAKPIQTFDFVMERSNEVAGRMETMERDINANIRELQGRTGTLANVRRFAFHGIGYMDRAVVIPAWLGSYNKALSEGMTEAQAIHFADKVIRSTQGAGAAKDLAAVQRSSEWMKLATMFYSYASAFYNRQRNLGRDTRRAIGERDLKAFPGLLARAWWLFAVSPILGALPGALLSGGGPDDDESWLGWALGVMTGNFFYGVPLVRDIASSAVSGFDYSFTPASRMVTTLMDAAGDLKALVDMDEETETSKRSVKTAVESVGYVAKLPLGQVSNAAQFIADWASGEADPDGVGDWLTGLQRGKLEE